MLCQQKQTRKGNGLTQTGAYWWFVFVGNAREGAQTGPRLSRSGPTKRRTHCFKRPALGRNSPDKVLEAMRFPLSG